MILPDVNVLICALRADLPQHEVCRPWLVDVVCGDARFGLSAMVLGAVVRITTNLRIFKMPSSIAEAFDFCQSLFTQPHCQLIEPGERHWDIFRNLCVRADVRGPSGERRVVCGARHRVGLARSHSIATSPVFRDSTGVRRRHEVDHFLSRKYGSTGPCTLIVSGLP
jgi:uncharacterized protein